MKKIAAMAIIVGLLTISFGSIFLGSAKPAAVELTIIVSDQQAPAIEGVVDDFLASDLGDGVDDVKVIASGTRADDQLTYLVTQMTGEAKEFDVIGLDPIWTAQFAENGWVIELTDLLETDEMDDYVDGMVTSCTYEGDKIWAYPYFMNLGVMFYRKDIISRNGFTIGDFDTWDEFKTNTIKILGNTTEQTLEPDLVGYVGQFDAYEGGVCNFIEWLGGNGVTDIFDADGNPNLNTSKAQVAMEFLKGLIAPRYTGMWDDKGKTTGYIIPRSGLTMDEGSSVGKWLAGESIFMRQWTFAYGSSASTLNLNATDTDGDYTQFGVAPLPTKSGAAAEKSSVVGGAVLSIPKYSENQDEALNLIRFLGDKAAQLYELTEVSNFPALKAAYDDLPAGYEWAGEFYDAFDKTLARPVHPKYSLISSSIADKFSDLLSGVKSVGQALGEMDADIAEIIGGRPTPGFELPVLIAAFGSLAAIFEIRRRKKK
ncbi:MAG: extracellular solute-binding protein [Promethearchaeota archaeon]